VKLPEDILQEKSGDPLRRDVFLVGVAAHQILFGAIPEGEPPEWNADIDGTGEFRQLHDWFAQVLDLDQNARFPDARTTLEAFNSATAERPTKQEVRLGLERLTQTSNSQRKLFSAYPIDGEPIKETGIIDTWRSVIDGEKSVLVKMWKQPAWGDFDKEGKRILAFLEQAIELKADAPNGIPQIREVLWLSDAFAIVQDWIDGQTLSDALGSPPVAWLTPEDGIAAVQALEARISSLHEAGRPHGDLKPSNMVVRGAADFAVIDYLDFSPNADGELQNRLYSAGGDRYERDRFAVLKMAQEILSLVPLPAEVAAKISVAIDSCQTMSPRLSTLTPLSEVLQSCLEELRNPPSASFTPIAVKISVRGSAVGDLVPEEGLYHVRTYQKSAMGPTRVYIRGAFEELEFRLDDNSKVRSAARRAISPTRIAIIEKHESYSFEGQVEILDSVSNEFSAMDEFLFSPDYLESLSEGQVDEPDVEEVHPSPRREEELEELISEERSTISSTTQPSEVDVPRLWRELIESEKELTTEAIALVESAYDHSIRRHKVPIDLESGVFDFDRNDTVEVRKLHNGSWRRIGELDLERSTTSAAFVDAYQYGYSGALIAAEQRLQFISHFEAESLKRRAGAVDRTLAGFGKAEGLVSVFDPATGAVPSRIVHKVNDADLTAYELNDDQKKALETIVTVRPVGLLQGPPGTGKTRFIAALAHYAITKGLAKNVLLSSQSHEAVNTAGEALLKLFRKSGGDPSALRVGMNEEQVSDEVRPFHTVRVEQALKDRFDSSYDSRMKAIGDVLGLPPLATEDILTFERNVGPISRRICDLGQITDRNDARITGLRQTLAALLDRLAIPESLMDLLEVDHDVFIEQALEALLGKHRSLTATPERIARLRSAIRIGADFVTSTSNHFRSFEPFLAATRQIVMGTCVGLGRTSLGLIGTAFDLVIVDEAARCTASELLVPLQAARWAVLVGDQAQLEPLHRPEVVSKVRNSTRLPLSEIKRSDFDRVFASLYGEEGGARLKTQYRMLEPIGRVVSEAFYPDLKLRAGRTDPVIHTGALPDEFGAALAWIDMDSLSEYGFDSPGGKTGSRTNKAEAEAIVRVLEQWHQRDAFKTWLTSQTAAPVAVGIICMYAAQRDLLRRKLLRSPLAAHLDRHIKVGTVDSYQGKENPIVLLSLVRNNKDGTIGRDGRYIAEGFLATPNRINVAASRAMDRLVVFGSFARWPAGGPMSRLTGRFKEAIERGDARLIDAATLLQRDKATPRGDTKDISSHGR